MWQSFVNEYLFRNVCCPSNWAFPLNKEKTDMGDVKLVYWHACIFIDNLDLLVNIAISADKESERSSLAIQGCNKGL
jgi:hypothetical protein